jgi:hypothetical protein
MDEIKNVNKFEYNNKKLKNKKTTITVALPGLNCEKIIWLALESLVRQKVENIYWELICVEEYGYSREIIKNFIPKFKNCKRVVHEGIDPKKIGIKKGKNKGIFPLIDKWIHISKLADNSDIFVLHAVDCYSSPFRFKIHTDHFSNKKCIFSSQNKGVFYNINNDDIMFYDYTGNDLYAKTHLNMALRTNHMKKYVNNKTKTFNRYIDKHIIKCILDSLGQKKLTKYNHFLDNSVNENNWKYSLDTDGFNNISLSRSKLYDDVNNDVLDEGLKYVWKNKNTLKLNNYNNIEDYIPQEILMKLKNINSEKNIEGFDNINVKKCNIIKYLLIILVTLLFFYYL